MPISIGQPVESDFHNPLGMLSDCHRRIARFLEALINVTERARGDSLDLAQIEALETALKYFREASRLVTLRKSARKWRIVAA